MDGKGQPIVAVQQRQHGHGGATDRLLVLDGLRGIAAIAVVLFHFGLTLHLHHLLAHAYLAVDFFFCLSGFVIARAYDRDLNSSRLTSGRFVLARVVRLWPQIIFGSVVGWAMLVLGRLSGVDLDFTGIPVFSFLATCILFPFYPWVNGSYWSLFAEVAANLAYLWSRKLRGGTGAVALAILMAVVVSVAAVRGSIHFGPENGLALGVLRACAEFFEGVALCRYATLHVNDTPAISPIILVLSMLAIFIVPGSMQYYRPIVDVLSAMVALPAIVYLGARSEAGIYRNLCCKLGDVSYPLYAIHLPIVIYVGATATKAQLAWQGNLGIAVISTCLLVYIAGLDVQLYDVPARSGLRRLFGRSGRHPVVTD